MKFHIIFSVIFIVTMANDVMSDNADLYKVNFYESFLGLSAEKIISQYRSQAKLVDMADHDPETYKKVMEFIIDEETKLYFDLNNKMEINYVSFNSYKFKTNLGLGLGDPYCDIGKAYPDFVAEDGFSDMVGDAIYLKKEGSPLVFMFGKPREIDLQYYSRDAAQCYERLLKLELSLEAD